MPLPVDLFFELAEKRGIPRKLKQPSCPRKNRVTSWVEPLFDDEAEILFDQPAYERNNTTKKGRE